MNVISPLLIIIDDNNDDDTIKDTNTASGYINMIVALLSIEQHSDNIDDVDDNVDGDVDDDVDNTQMCIFSDIF